MSEIDLARKVISAYAEGLDGLTEADCRGLVEEGGLSEFQCSVLMDELNMDNAAYDHGSRFSEAGLSDAFIGELLGENGERAFYRRARWLADNYSKCPLDDPAECKEWKPSVIQFLGRIHLMFSENPVPPLIRNALRDKGSPEVRRAALNAAEYLHSVCDIPAFASFLSDGDAWIRDLAVRRIGESIGCGDSRLAYRRLMAVLRSDEDKSVRQSALNALGKLGPYAWRAAPYLLELVRTTENGDANFYGNLSYALQSIACGRAMPALIAGMKDTDPAVRSAALDAVACINVEEEKSEFESAMLFSKVGRDREQTYALRDIERALAPAVPVLIEILDQGDMRTRERAIEALGRIGKTSAPAVQQISYYLKNDDPWVRQTAAVALARIGTDESFLALAESMHEWGVEFGVWLLSVSGVENLGPEAAEKVARIFADMLDSEERDRRLLAALALVKLKADTAKALPILIEALEEEGSEPDLWALRSAFIEAAGEVGAGAVEAVPLLVRLWKGGELYTSSSALGALGRIGPAAKDALPALLEAFDQSEDPLVEAETILNITTEVDAVVSFLVRCMKEDENTWNRSRAAELLVGARHAYNRVVPALIEALKDIKPGVRISAAGALGRIGDQAVDALPHLEALFRDDYSEVRSAAKQARKTIRDAMKKKRGA